MQAISRFLYVTLANSTTSNVTAAVSIRVNGQTVGSGTLSRTNPQFTVQLGDTDEFSATITSSSGGTFQRWATAAHIVEYSSGNFRFIDSTDGGEIAAMFS